MKRYGQGLERTKPWWMKGYDPIDVAILVFIGTGVACAALGVGLMTAIVFAVILLGGN